MTDKKPKAKIFDDIDEKKLENAAEVLPRLTLPQPADPARNYKLLGEPEIVDVASRPGDTMIVVEAESDGITGSLIIGKSLEFNMGAAIKRRKQALKGFKFKGTTWRIWSIMDGQNKYYQTAMV